LRICAALIKPIPGSASSAGASSPTSSSSCDSRSAASASSVSARRAAERAQRDDRRPVFHRLRGAGVQAGAARASCSSFEGRRSSWVPHTRLRTPRLHELDMGRLPHPLHAQPAHPCAQERAEVRRHDRALDLRPARRRVGARAARPHRRPARGPRSRGGGAARGGRAGDPRFHELPEGARHPAPALPGRNNRRGDLPEACRGTRGVHISIFLQIASISRAAKFCDRIATSHRRRSRRMLDGQTGVESSV
jgi:hypothetical protein